MFNRLNKIGRPLAFFSPIKRYNTTSNTAKLQFMQEHSTTIIELLDAHGIKISSTDLDTLNTTLQKYATTHSSYYSSNWNFKKILLCAESLGFCQNATTSFHENQYDLIIPDQPGFAWQTLFTQLQQIPQPNTIFCVMNTAKPTTANRVEHFQMHMTHLNESLSRKRLPQFTYQFCNVTPKRNLSPAMQEIDIAQKLYIPLLNQERVAVLLNQPRLSWLRDVYLKELQKSVKTIQFISQGVNETNHLSLCLSALACMVEVEMKQHTETAKCSLQSFKHKIV